MKCKICLEDKSEEDFYKNCRTCKKCRCFQTNEWRMNNRARVQLLQKERREKDPEKARLKERKLYRKNHEAVLKKAAKWREENREKSRESTRKWQENNRDKVNEYVRKNKEKQKEYALRSKNKNLERFKENIRRNIRLAKERYPEKTRARKILWCALRVGHLIRPSSCSRCLKECKPEGHHADYLKPLEVEWVCRKCHNIIHGKCKAVLQES